MAIQLGKVDPYQQSLPYTCGAATLYAVLKHYGITHLDEDALASLIGVDPENGASMDKLVYAATTLGLRAGIYRFQDLPQVKRLINMGIPPIANIQSYTNPLHRHYVVITSIDGKYVYLMDPNVKGNLRVLPHAEMLKQWTGWRNMGYAGVVISPNNP
jgi:predicted double-glycine peptidase